MAIGAVWTRLCLRLQGWWNGDGHGDTAGDGAAPLADAVPTGDPLLDEVADGELLAAHAVRHKLPASAADLACLQGARCRLAALRSQPAQAQAFRDALQRVAAANPVSAAEWRATAQRQRRLAPALADAQRLLLHACARGQALDDAAISAPILAALDAAASDTLTAAQAAAFLTASRALSVAMAPVSAGTLEASETRLPPKLLDLLTRPRVFLHDLRVMTLGRFAHFLCFALVLAGAGLGIAYQTIGEAALARYEELGTRLVQGEAELRKLRLTERERQNALFLLTERHNGRDSQQLAAELSLQSSIGDIDAAQQALGRMADERSRLPDTLRRWNGQPCGEAALAWLCAFSVAVSDATHDDEHQVVFESRMALKRLNLIVLPMLLGLLGAYSYVLRGMSREIQLRAFEPYSLLHHVVRLSLGALAGVAAGWLLKPEQVGLLSSVPAWVLAFVAGYGIELLFSFLDRVVGSFSAQQSVRP